MEPFFEYNKNRAGGFEYPFYVHTITTEREGYEAYPHMHYHIELLYFPYGTAKLFVGNKFINVSANELVLINPCEVHSVTIEANTTSKHFIIGFDPELLGAVSNMDFEMKYLLPQAVNTNPKFRVMNLDPSNNINTLLEELQLEYSNKRIGFEFAVTSHIYMLMTCLLRHLKNNGFVLSAESPLVKNNRMKLMKVLEFIDDHYNENITATAAADMCFLSYSHFSKLIKSVLHTTFIQYLNYLRVRKAETLLLDGEKTITQIAQEVGYNDVSYFIKQFKHYKDISPKQYQHLLVQLEK